ncbi:MAG: type I-E CRISPR-associated protein Cas6/Cse3/CasE [Planctomycetaceae bacterium]|nr:type I-E CRISPR-associated protein Cas6/Cse3/CasE [Planctomycetaceae bacterium]
MMFLSRLTLTLQDHRAFRITDDYSIHRVVYSLFPENADAGRILYADRGMRNAFHTILILSKIRPVCSPETPQNIETKEIEPGFLKHSRYAFEILLNPVRSKSHTKQLEPIKGEILQYEWFLEKAAANGFTLTPEDKSRLVIHSEQTLTFRQKDTPERKVTHHRVRFSGTLTVSDPELFQKAFEQGIGRAKAFGFGMLQLVPVWD